MALLNLPVTSYPDVEQVYALEGVNYVCRTRWNERASAWFLDVALEDGTAIVTGRKITVSQMLGYRSADSRRFPGWLVALDSSGVYLDPTETDLGTRVQLYYLESV